MHDTSLDGASGEDTQSGEAVQPSHVELRGHSDAVWAVAVDPATNNILTGSGDHTAKLWSADGALLETLKGHSDTVWGVGVLPGSRYVTASGDKTLRVWGLPSQLAGPYHNAPSRRASTLEQTRSRRGSAKAGPESGQPLSRTKTRLEEEQAPLDPDKLCTLITLRGHSSHVFAVAVDHTTGNIVSGSGDKTAKVWSSKDGKRLINLVPHNGAVMAVAVDRKSGNIVTGAGDRKIRVWCPVQADGMGGAQIHTLAGHLGSIVSLAVHPHNSNILSGSSDEDAMVWNADGEMVHTLTGHEGTVNAVAVHPKTGDYITASIDRSIRVWSDDGQLTQVLEGHKGSLNDVAVHTSTGKILSASHDRTAGIW